jgi:hypothetical protein
MPALGSKLAIQFRTIGPGFMAWFESGARVAAEEEVEVRVRTPRDTAPALRLTLDDRNLHERQARRRSGWVLRTEGTLTSTGRATRMRRAANAA